MGIGYCLDESDYISLKKNQKKTRSVTSIRVSKEVFVLLNFFFSFYLRVPHNHLFI